MPITFEINENQSVLFKANLRDDQLNPIGSADVYSFLLTQYDLNTNTIINSRNKQNVLNTNDVTLDVSGNVEWSVQSADTIILSNLISEGQKERHAVLFEWMWGSNKYANELYYFDIIAINAIGILSTSYYGSVLEGDTYFGSRLNTQPWTVATEANKIKSLKEASRMIDRLNFKGSKASISQALEFPRDSDTVVPMNIRYATYEIALKLLDDYDPDLEIENLSVEVQGYDKVRRQYNRTFVPEHISSGIVSYRAWQYLKPYLRDPNLLVVSRES